MTSATSDVSAAGEALQPPYYAVIFSSTRKRRQGDGYAEMAAKMEALAKEQSGYLGVESVSSQVASSSGRMHHSLMGFHELLIRFIQSLGILK